uniref:HTH luxR-type domain-containing protein n=1 Tax=Steinernema glaseri TaxID=37863 RepID=A0A1I8A1W3_9BILA
MRADSNQCLAKPTTMSLSPQPPKPLRRCRSASPAPPRAPLLTQEQQLLLSLGRTPQKLRNIKSHIKRATTNKKDIGEQILLPSKP